MVLAQTPPDGKANESLALCRVTCSAIDVETLVCWYRSGACRATCLAIKCRTISRGTLFRDSYLEDLRITHLDTCGPLIIFLYITWQTTFVTALTFQKTAGVALADTAMFYDLHSYAGNKCLVILRPPDFGNRRRPKKSNFNCPPE